MLKSVVTFFLFMFLGFRLQAEPLAQVQLKQDYGNDWNQTLNLSVMSQMLQGPNGEVRKLFSFNCHVESSFCQQLCSQRLACSLNFETCEGCASAENLRLFSIFQDIQQFYIPIPQSLTEIDLLNLVLDEKLKALESNSILNLMLDPTDDALNQKTKDEFLSLCPLGTESAFVLANRTFVPRAVVCINQQKSLVYRLKVNPGFVRSP